jgi:hypothetical protein
LRGNIRQQYKAAGRYNDFSRGHFPSEILSSSLSSCTNRVSKGMNSIFSAKKSTNCWRPG